MADEMDINLEVFNLETDFFGDLHCSSRFTDMLCDAQAQYGDYSELEKCPMWGMWMKEAIVSLILAITRIISAKKTEDRIKYLEEHHLSGSYDEVGETLTLEEGI